MPGLFLLSAFLLLSSLFALIGLNLGGAVLGLLAVFLYRLARVAGMMTMGRAVAYAVLILLVLVGVTQAVYMASSQFFPSS